MTPTRILYLRLDGIGDAILSNCLLEGLAAVYPGVPVTVVCDRPVAPIFAASPFVDAVIPVQRGLLPDAAYREELSARLATCGADLAFNGMLSPSASMAALMENLPLPLMSLPPDHANMPPARRDAFAARIDTLIPVRAAPRQEREAYADALAARATRESTAVQAGPRLWFRPEDEMAAETLWRASGLPRGRTIALFAAGAMAEKGYTGYGDALLPLCREYGLSVAALGAARDAALADVNLEPLRRGAVRVENLCRDGSILRPAALLRDCRLALGADTGLAHAACAVGTPLVTLVSGVFFGRFFPYQTGVSAVYLPLACAPCSGRCRYERPLCMTGITPATIEEAVRHVLESAGSSPRKTLFLQHPAAAPHDVQGRSLWQSPEAFIRAYKKAPGDERLHVVIGSAPENASGIL